MEAEEKGKHDSHCPQGAKVSIPAEEALYNVANSPSLFKIKPRIPLTPVSQIIHSADVWTPGVRSEELLYPWVHIHDFFMGFRLSHSKATEYV